MKRERDKRKLSAILSADVVGYSRLMEKDASWTIKNLEENKTLISDLVEEYKGRVVDAPGDNLLAEFISVTNAVECAVEIQKELNKKNSKLMESHRMEFRIGINLGEVFEEDGRIYGSGVNIAARIEGLSKSGGICISGRTYDHVKTEFDFGYEYLGDHTVKNISEPIRIYRLLMDSENAGKVIGEKKAPSRKSYRIAIAAVVILIIIAAVSIGWNIYSPKTDESETFTEQVPIATDVKEAPKTIAVLPFDDYSPEKDQEYFVLGLSEEILNSLTQIKDLSVRAKTSSFSFRGKDDTIQEIASVLEVDHILEGSVRKAGNTIRITAQLIRTADGSHLWSETYNKELKVEEMFSVQEDIATAVANELKLTLGVGETLKQLGSTDNLEAYEHFLVAKGHMNDIFKDMSILNLAEESLDAAIELDPDFALAWAYKVCIHWFQLTLTTSYRLNLDQDPGLNAALRAIELEPNLAEAHYSLGLSRFLRGELIEAEFAYRKAMELSYDPINSNQFGLPVFSLSVGACERANEIIEASRKIDPLNQSIYGNYVVVPSLCGNVQLAEDRYKRGEEIFGDQWDPGNVHITVLRLGIREDVSRDDIEWSFDLHDFLKDHLNSPKEGLSELRRFYNSDDFKGGSQNSWFILYASSWAAYFGDLEFAMDLMGRMSNIEKTSLFWIWFPVFNETRQLSRFKEFVKEIGLVDYWKEYGWPDLCRPIGEDDFECD